MTCRTHRLEILNLDEGEIINHAILLIKGRIHPRCDEPIILKTDICKQLTTSASKSGEFKLLLDLRKLEDSVSDIITLRFSCCNALNELKVVYKKPNREFKVQPLFIVCANSQDKSSFPKVEEALKIIDLNVRVVQCVYAEKLRSAGFGRKTFALNDACKVFHSLLPYEEAWNLTESELWDHFAKEIINSEWVKSNRLKFVGFINCTKYDGEAVVASGNRTYENIRKHLKAHVALGGGGLALFGSAYFYAWPQHFEKIIHCFSNQTKIDIARHADDSNYRRTFGGVYATTLGTICHEIGHTFDLGHTEDGVMGMTSSVDYLHRVFIVNDTTENLPNRVLSGEATGSESSHANGKLTNLRSSSNAFLTKYHEQKENDSFYFTRNCTVVLAYHKWLNDKNYNDINANIALNILGSSPIVVSTDPLKLIEVRKSTSSLMTYFHEFETPPKAGSDNFYRFRLPESVFDYFHQKTHYLFVLTIYGDIKRFHINEEETEIIEY